MPRLNKLIRVVIFAYLFGIICSHPRQMFFKGAAKLLQRQKSTQHAVHNTARRQSEDWREEKRDGREEREEERGGRESASESASENASAGAREGGTGRDGTGGEGSMAPGVGRIVPDSEWEPIWKDLTENQGVCACVRVCARACVCVCGVGEAERVSASVRCRLAGGESHQGARCGPLESGACRLKQSPFARLIQQFLAWSRCSTSSRV